jgi:alkylation response protein AidB-like acyl-CoA dehydrogenase
MDSTSVTASATPRGGGWLVEDLAPGAIFSVEKFSDEHRLIARTADDFMRHEVAPALERLEQKDWSLARTLVRRCGELGLIGTDVPEAYGGVELDKVSSIIVGEAVGAAASFASTFGAQSGLAITPILCFGTEDQKARYLPRLVTGEIVGAYSLSESGSGSDALGAKTKATRQPDGSYLLTGEKMWITNGGFADLFVVFAKVDGEHFSAFLVERGFQGVSTGKEEHKMGLYGSSTTPLILQDAVVPASQLLGEVGRGHKVAFNVLNYGRLKLAAMCSGGARIVIAEAARYAKERKQFGQAIANFGAIRHKLAEMTIREFAVESMLYRTAGLIDGAIHGSTAPDGVLTALEEFAMEASALKVAGSEMLDYVVDENVQIHGGNGFVRDYAAERHYRDARVNRIFEGTNEVNRLLIPNLLVRRALKGALPLGPMGQQVQSDPAPGSLPGSHAGTALDAELRVVAAMKKVALLVIGTAVKVFGDQLAEQQEILSSAADIVIDVFAADSSVLRAAAMPEGVSHAVARVLVNEAAGRVAIAARTAAAGMLEGTALEATLAKLPRLLEVTPINTVALRRQVADAVLARPGYPF